ncbi:thioredoxin family protein [Streptomyces cavernicola]|uniref:Thioredoxin n=1 Tax=Streptomyces cavernicola TaxID=3043613 RepID=A0ABT6SMT2_9ACTN|nr:thioredoxin domain-containing protein [Streptomyces sp. B-S-A6]MDI3409505.1 thioredoxin domain-containing protein [Streptomyces sp. B-S-A6]
MAGTLTEVTDADFDSVVLKCTRPVLVHFWAPWSGPCRQITSSLQAIAAEHGDRIEIVKLNTDENPTITSRCGIISIPTMNIYQGGEVAKTITGARPKYAIENDLHRHVAVVGAECLPPRGSGG